MVQRGPWLARDHATGHGTAESVSHSLPAPPLRPIQASFPQWLCPRVPSAVPDSHPTLEVGTDVAAQELQAPGERGWRVAAPAAVAV